MYRSVVININNDSYFFFFNTFSVIFNNHLKIQYIPSIRAILFKILFR